MQAQLGRNGRRRLKHTKHNYLLEGIATCALCGAPMRIHCSTEYGGAPRRSYVCTRRHASHRMDGDPYSLPLRRTEAVDRAVWREVAERLARPDLLAEALR